jgi:hypothetical protein
LANNGGPTQNVALLPGSPAIGTGGALTNVVANAVGPADTTIYVGNAATIAATPGTYYILIDQEELLVTNVNLTTNTLTVQRGYNGTTATSHAVGAGVYLATDQRGIQRPTPPDIGAYQSAPYLEASDVSDPATAIPGQTVTVTWTDTNSGSATATGQWVDNVYAATDAQGDQPTLLASFPVTGPLAVGASVQLTQQVTLPQTAGPVYLMVTTNATLSVPEGGSGAGQTAVASVPTQIVPVLEPDLVVTSITPPLSGVFSRTRGRGQPLQQPGTTGSSCRRTPLWARPTPGCSARAAPEATQPSSNSQSSWGSPAPASSLPARATSKMST